jgi:hypothetical protein
MIRYLLNVFILALLVTKVFAQAQFVTNGTNAIGVGVGYASASPAASMSAKVGVTLSGRLDLSLDHAVTNAYGATQGSATSASLSWLFLRRDSAMSYSALHLGCIWDDQLTRGIATSVGLSIGLLPISQMIEAAGVSVQPSLSGELILPTNGYLVVTGGVEVAFLIPISGPSSLVTSIAYARTSTKYAPGTDIIGAQLAYIFGFKK